MAITRIEAINRLREAGLGPLDAEEFVRRSPFILEDSFTDLQRDKLFSEVEDVRGDGFSLDRVLGLVIPELSTIRQPLEDSLRNRGATDQQVTKFFGEIEDEGIDSIPGELLTKIESEFLTTAGAAPPATAPDAGITSIDDLIRKVQPEAEGLLTGGAAATQFATGIGGELSERRARPFIGGEDLSSVTALDEIAALLGIEGPEAQQTAFSQIPQSDFERERDARQQKATLRTAAASGDLGSGSTIQDIAQLATAQASGRLTGRLASLQPLLDIAQTTRGGISSQREGTQARIAGSQAGLGPQLANVGLGLAPLVTEARTSAAEVEGLRGLSNANEQASISGAIANLAGGVAGNAGVQGAARFIGSDIASQFGPSTFQQALPTAPTGSTFGNQNINFNTSGLA